MIDQVVVSGRNGFGSRIFFASTLLLAACAPDGATTPVAKVGQGIVGGNSRNVTFEEAMPYRAVGRLQFPGGSCSATPIQRDVILTAAHCYFDNDTTIQDARDGNIRFHLRYTDATGAETELQGRPGETGIRSRGGARWATADIRDGDGQAAQENRIIDLAVVLLERNLTVEEVRVIPDVGNTGHIPLQPRITGWDGSQTTKRGGTPEFVSTRQDCGFLGAGSCGPKWIISERTGARHERGDSGGPLTSGLDDAVIIAVWSGTTGCDAECIDSDDNDGQDVYSPTFNIGAEPIDNRRWIMQFILDGDGDDVNDTVDNCPPSRCLSSSSCFNPNQDDDDDDGVGDVCDNCPPRRCLIPEACKNPSQSDALDHDGVGDVCDPCPTLRTSTEISRDNDGLPGECDNCERVNNGLRACTNDAGCSSANQGTCMLGESQVFGVCVAGTNSQAACTVNGQCPGGSCQLIGSFGRCTAQANTDGDSFGDACDSCVDIRNDDTQENSNDLSEVRESVATQGDLCDIVPVFASRPVVLNNPTGENTFFRSTAGIGRPTSFRSNVGFRWCDCTSRLVNRASCTARFCSIDPSLFSRPEGAAGNPWHRVTTGTNGPTAFPSMALPPAQYDAPPRSRIFTNTSTCLLRLDQPTLPSNDGTCRIGPQEHVVWFTGQDIAAGRIEPELPNTLRTSGLFWGHVEVLSNEFSDGASGTRDAATAGRLRDSVSLVHTPAIALPPDTMPPDLDNACGVALRRCFPSFRRDFLVNPDPIIDPDNAFGWITTLGELVRDPGNGRVGAIRGAGDPIYDITDSLSQGVLELLAGSPQQFLTPVETGAAGGQLSPPRQWVSIPAMWLADSSQVTSVLVDGGRLVTEGEVRPPDPTITTRVASTPVPSNRFGASGVLSIRDTAVYLVGGRDTDENGPPTGEIWSYDLNLGTWNQVFTATSGLDPMRGEQFLGVPDLAAVPGRRQFRPGDVLATAYDSERGVLLVLDRVVLEDDERHRRRHRRASDRHQREHAVVRLVRYDMKAQSSSLVEQWVDTGAFERIGMAAVDNGAFVLVVAPRHGHRWTALEFVPSQHRGIRWKAIHEGRGEVVDQPIHTTYGTYLPTKSREVGSLTLLEFRPLRLHERGLDRF